jgi:hypothetical protein
MKEIRMSAEVQSDLENKQMKWNLWADTRSQCMKIRLLINDDQD